MFAHDATAVSSHVDKGAVISKKLNMNSTSVIDVQEMVGLCGTLWPNGAIRQVKEASADKHVSQALEALPFDECVQNVVGELHCVALNVFIRGTPEARVHTWVEE
jgi:hypothetical protein